MTDAVGRRPTVPPPREAGYVRTERVVNFEATQWDTRAEDQLVWTASLVTTNPSSGGQFVKSLTTSMVTSLEKGGLIPKR